MTTIPNLKSNIHIKNMSNLSDSILLIKPSGFDSPSSMYIPDILISGAGIRVGSVAAKYNRPTGKKYYVSTTGSDSSDGLTPGTAFRTIQKAVDQTDVDEVILESGFYDRNKGIAIAPTRDVSIVCESGECILGGYSSLTWTPDATYTNCERATRSSAYLVIDTDVLDAYGMPTAYTQQSTEALCDANPGSWWTDNSTVLVNPSAGSSVGNNTAVMLTVNIMKFSQTSVYLENIKIWGGINATTIDNNVGTSKRAGFKNCQFAFAQDDGLQIRGEIESIAENCLFHGNLADGVNYNSLSGILPNAVEIKCVGRNNGSVGDNDNGSSNHGGYTARFGCEFHGNKGPNCVDVGSMKTWCVDCYAHGSTASSPNDYDFGVEGSMWLDKCRGGTGAVISGNMYVTYDTKLSYTPYEKYSRNR